MIFLLGIWRCHADYQIFMIESVNREFKRNPKAIAHFEDAVLKMYFLNLDCVRDDFEPLFSSTGKPSNQQPEIFRSFVLMNHFKYHQLEKWISFAKSSVILSALIGVLPDNLPGESTHRDFYSRLWQSDSSVNSCFHSPETKPSKKYGNNKVPP